MIVTRQTLTATWTASLCVFGVCIGIFVQPAEALKITEPANGATLVSGVTVNARVDLGKDSGIVTVRYYWYGEQDESLVEQDDITATGSIVAPAVLTGQAQHNPPFGGPLVIPKDGIGP